MNTEGRVLSGPRSHSVFFQTWLIVHAAHFVVLNKVISHVWDKIIHTEISECVHGKLEQIYSFGKKKKAKMRTLPFKNVECYIKKHWFLFAIPVPKIHPQKRFTVLPPAKTAESHDIQSPGVANNSMQTHTHTHTNVFYSHNIRKHIFFYPCK